MSCSALKSRGAGGGRRVVKKSMSLGRRRWRPASGGRVAEGAGAWRRGAQAGLPASTTVRLDGGAWPLPSIVRRRPRAAARGTAWAGRHRPDHEQAVVRVGPWRTAIGSLPRPVDVVFTTEARIGQTTPSSSASRLATVVRRGEASEGAREVGCAGEGAVGDGHVADASRRKPCRPQHVRCRRGPDSAHVRSRQRDAPSSERRSRAHPFVAAQVAVARMNRVHRAMAGPRVSRRQQARARST